MIQNWDEVSGDLLGNIFSGTGLVFFGGLIGGALGVIMWARWRGFLDWELLDATPTPLAIGYAVGRIGCQLSGDGDYGDRLRPAVGDVLPRRHRADHRGGSPDAVYETFTMGLVTLLLWNLRDRLGPACAVRPLPGPRGTGRFLVEFIRRNDSVAAGLTFRSCSAWR